MRFTAHPREMTGGRRVFGDPSESAQTEPTRVPSGYAMPVREARTQEG